MDTPVNTASRECRRMVLVVAHRTEGHRRMALVLAHSTEGGQEDGANVVVAQSIEGACVCACVQSNV